MSDLHKWADRNFLFVCGVPRSGTTAMAEWLNRHPEIAVGIERFKNINKEELAPDLFTRERFFDFRPSDTNIQRPELYEAIAAKFDVLTWVGDKVPRFYMLYDELFSRFENCIIIYMIRAIGPVARSWNARAFDPNDTPWPEKNDYKRAVEEWNTANDRTMVAKAKYKNRLLMVEYEELFSVEIPVLQRIVILQRLMRKLGLGLPTDMNNKFRKWTPNRKPTMRPELSEDQVQYVSSNANLPAYIRLCELAIRGGGPKAMKQETLPID